MGRYDEDCDLLDQGCNCPRGNPPCSFCTDAFESIEEYEIYQEEGVEAVREYRRGERPERLRCEEVERAAFASDQQRMLSSVKYGRF